MQLIIIISPYSYIIETIMAPYCGKISAVSILTGYYKAPPAYSDDQDYIDWEIDLWFWQEITALEKKRQVSASLSTGGAKCKETAANCCKLLLTAANCC